MHRMFWIAFLLQSLIAAQAHAGLTLVGETKESIIYLNLDGAEIKAALIKAEGSQDFHQQQQLSGHAYLSAQFTHEFDCEKKLSRQLKLSIYPENMANGGALLTDTETKPWSAPTAGSSADVMWKKACASLTK